MDIDLLKKFYNGECSREEVQEVNSWFSSKEQKEALLAQLQADWEGFDLMEEEVLFAHQPGKILQGIHSRIRKDAASEGKDQKVRYLNINRFYSLRIASIVILAVCLSFVMHIFLQNRPDERNFLVISEVPAGEKRSILLEDGTKVTLNAGSRISYPRQFSNEKREVSLEGEAFFEVAKEAERPFLIKSGELSTRVLGTSFNIRAYKDEPDMEVAVASGKVKVSQNAQEAYLLPGKAVNYNIEKQLFKVHTFDRQKVFAWKEGSLYFKDASYQEVIAALERWYGVEIRSVGEQKEEWQYSGAFQQESLENVLRSIGYVKQFSHSKRGKQVVLTFDK